MDKAKARKLARKFPGTVFADRAALKAMVGGVIDAVEEGTEAHARLCGVLMPLVGAQLPEGGLAPSFAESGYWAGTGAPDDPLRPSEHAKLLARAAVVATAVANAR